ncbi:hypothetical protein ILYODFUR_029138 [Ilyodon furcidens]|uniref:Uncharacterized protein n=1 Tax=Ilyodon furcidens TaxID=33524 RepID=A0ABV0SQX1_9TELE
MLSTLPACLSGFWPTPRLLLTPPWVHPMPQLLLAPLSVLLMPQLLTLGPPDASASYSGVPSYTSERIEDDQPPSPGPEIFQGYGKEPILMLVPELCDEGFKEEPSLVPVPKPSNEGFEEEPSLVPVPKLKKKPVLLLLPELSDKGFEDEPPHFPEPEEKTQKLWPESKPTKFRLGPNPHGQSLGEVGHRCSWLPGHPSRLENRPPGPHLHCRPPRSLCLCQPSVLNYSTVTMPPRSLSDCFWTELCARSGQSPGHPDWGMLFCCFVLALLPRLPPPTLFMLFLVFGLFVGI